MKEKKCYLCKTTPTTTTSIVETINIIYVIIGIAGTIVAVVTSILVGFRIIINKSNKGAVGEHRLSTVESTVNGLPCDKHEKEVFKISFLTTNIDIIKESVRRIENHLIKNNPESVDTLLRKCSPYRITSFGEALLDISGAKVCIDENLPFFDTAIFSMSPKVALDVENYALDILHNNLKEDFFNKIKDYLFALPSPTVITDKEGNEASLDIQLDAVLKVMSIYLRDKYFENHPEINISGFFEKV